MKTITEGQEIEIRTKGKRRLGTATYCPCGALCAINVVTLVNGSPGLPIVSGPISELNASFDDDQESYSCDACT